MASITLAPQTGWAVGETISVYEVDARRVRTGSAVTTGTVEADSTTPLTGLDSNQRYIATGGTSTVSFSTLLDRDVIPPGGTTGQVLAKASDADGDFEWSTP